MGEILAQHICLSTRKLLQLSLGEKQQFFWKKMLRSAAARCASEYRNDTSDYKLCPLALKAPYFHVECIYLHFSYFIPSLLSYSFFVSCSVNLSARTVSRTVSDTENWTKFRSRRLDFFHFYMFWIVKRLQKVERSSIRNGWHILLFDFKMVGPFKRLVCLLSFSLIYGSYWD